jgi:hypothetical protein
MGRAAKCCGTHDGVWKGRGSMSWRIFEREEGDRERGILVLYVWRIIATCMVLKMSVKVEVMEMGSELQFEEGSAQGRRRGEGAVLSLLCCCCPGEAGPVHSWGTWKIHS